MFAGIKTTHLDRYIVNSAVKHRVLLWVMNSKKNVIFGDQLQLIGLSSFRYIMKGHWLDSLVMYYSVVCTMGRILRLVKVSTLWEALNPY